MAFEVVHWRDGMVGLGDELDAADEAVEFVVIYVVNEHLAGGDAGAEGDGVDGVGVLEVDEAFDADFDGEADLVVEEADAGHAFEEGGVADGVVGFEVGEGCVGGLGLRGGGGQGEEEEEFFHGYRGLFCIMSSI